MQKWTIGYAAKNHVYLATAIFLTETETWNVLLKIDGSYRSAIQCDTPIKTALDLIEEATLDHVEVPEETNA